LQIVAHSLGTVAAAEAARCLSDCGPTRQLTLLDPPETFHDEIFCAIGAIYHAQVVENYWAPGVSGYGAHAAYPGVCNYQVEGPTPVRGIVDLSVSNHVYVMRWYYNTVRCASMACGFQKSVFLNDCLAGTYCRAGQGIPHRSDSMTRSSGATAPYVATTSAGSRKR
ncbi:MAG: hypothetical protein AAF961_19810, partial [Planctomycetota bacterium]